MRKTVTSRVEILQHCQNIVLNQGLTAIDIRTVASACHVSVGSIYNHFGSKDELVYAVLTEGWKDIFDTEEDLDQTSSFIDYIEQVYQVLLKKKKDRAGFLNYYSLGLAHKDPDLGLKLFNDTTQELRKTMVDVYRRDASMEQDLDEKALDEYIHLVFSILMTLLMEDLSSNISLDWALQVLKAKKKFA